MTDRERRFYLNSQRKKWATLEPTDVVLYKLHAYSSLLAGFCEHTLTLRSRRCAADMMLSWVANGWLAPEPAALQEYLRVSLAHFLKWRTSVRQVRLQRRAGRLSAVAPPALSAAARTPAVPHSRRAPPPPCPRAPLLPQTAGVEVQLVRDQPIAMVRHLAQFFARSALGRDFAVGSEAATADGAWQPPKSVLDRILRAAETEVRGGTACEGCTRATDAVLLSTLLARSRRVAAACVARRGRLVPPAWRRPTRRSSPLKKRGSVRPSRRGSRQP